MENGFKGAAIVTGASSGIGYEISKVLLQMGYEVYGIGRDFSKIPDEADRKFHKIQMDIQETHMLVEFVNSIRHEVTLLVNNAGTAYYGLHEELSPQKIKEMVRTNLEAPMILSNLLIRDLKINKGTVINVSSVTAEKTNPHGCAYGATKAGLTSFSGSLFEEARKYGLKVVNIEPDMTDTDLYRNADFTADDEIMAKILPQEVAKAVEFVLNQREGLVVSDLVIKPQLHRIKKKQQ